MRKLTMTVAVLLTVMSIAFASTGDTKSNRATVVKMKDNTYKVFYTSKEPSVVKIRLRDEKGHFIQTDRIKSEDGFMKPYDLTALKDGNYYFELIDQYGRLSKEVKIEETKNSVLAVKALENKKYQLLVEQCEMEPVKVTILNTKEEVLFNETYQGVKGFSQVFDLSKFSTDSFVFEISDNNSTRIVAVD